MHHTKRRKLFPFEGPSTTTVQSGTLETISSSRLEDTLRELHIEASDLEGFLVPPYLTRSAENKKFYCLAENCWSGFSRWYEVERHIEKFKQRGRGHMALYEMGVRDPCPRCNARIPYNSTPPEHFKKHHPKQFKSHLEASLSFFGFVPVSPSIDLPANSLLAQEDSVGASDPPENFGCITEQSLPRSSAKEPSRTPYAALELNPTTSFNQNALDVTRNPRRSGSIPSIIPSDRLSMSTKQSVTNSQFLDYISQAHDTSSKVAEIIQARPFDMPEPITHSGDLSMFTSITDQFLDIPQVHDTSSKVAEIIQARPFDMPEPSITHSSYLSMFATPSINNQFLDCIPEVHDRSSRTAEVIRPRAFDIPGDLSMVSSATHEFLNIPLIHDRSKVAEIVKARPFDMPEPLAGQSGGFSTIPNVKNSSVACDLTIQSAGFVPGYSNPQRQLYMPPSI